jgi:enterobactin synthetase component D
LNTLHQALDLPSGVRCVAMPLTQSEDVSGQEEAGIAAEWALACAGMAPKRRAEFVAGRRCAGQALAEAGGPLADRLVRGNDRLPVWPCGWLGSISHSGAWAVAVAGRSAQYLALGIDIQELISLEAKDGVEPLVATAGEMARVHALVLCGGGHRRADACWWDEMRDETALPQRRALTLLFSAKEALYKALYPQLRRFQGFDAAVADEWRPGALRFTLTSDWDALVWTAGVAIWLRYAWVGDMVATVVCLPVTPRTGGGNP